MAAIPKNVCEGEREREREIIKIKTYRLMLPTFARRLRLGFRLRKLNKFCLQIHRL